MDVVVGQILARYLRPFLSNLRLNYQKVGLVRVLHGCPTVGYYQVNLAEIVLVVATSHRLVGYACKQEQILNYASKQIV